MLDWFSSNKRPDLLVDIHSHLLPGLDDGVKNFEESLGVIKSMASLGFRKLVTTPHIYPEVYPNTPDTIIHTLSLLKEEVRKVGLDIKLEAAAEYYLDTSFLSDIKTGQRILGFGKAKYVLFETSFHNKPMILEETIFELKANSFLPVLAHPERYEYLDPKSELASTLKDLEVKFQVSLPSLKGYYGPDIKKKAMYYLKKGMVDFLGSDIHRLRQVTGLTKALGLRVPPNPLLNNSLL